MKKCWLCSSKTCIGHGIHLACDNNAKLSLSLWHHLKDIKDPELPFSLGELNAITEDDIEVDEKYSHVRVTFEPTEGNIVVATMTGLCLRVKLMSSLPPRYRVDIQLASGSLANEVLISHVHRHLNDEEQIAATYDNC